MTTSATVAAPAVEYVEITRKPRKPKQRRQANWMDLPLVYGQQGFEMRLKGSDKATLAYLYGSAIRLSLIGGNLYRVTMTEAFADAS